MDLISESVKLTKLSLATLVAWDAVHRTSPVAVPPLLGRLGCVGAAIAVQEYCSEPVLDAMVVTGVLMVATSRSLTVEPVSPWGSYVPWAWERVKAKVKRRAPKPGVTGRVQQRIGNRLPRL